MIQKIIDLDMNQFEFLTMLNEYLTNKEHLVPFLHDLKYQVFYALLFHILFAKLNVCQKTR
jgi:hypothetical protein